MIPQIRSKSPDLYIHMNWFFVWLLFGFSKTKDLKSELILYPFQKSAYITLGRKRRRLNWRYIYTQHNKRIYVLLLRPKYLIGLKGWHFEAQLCYINKQLSLKVKIMSGKRIARDKMQRKFREKGAHTWRSMDIIHRYALKTNKHSKFWHFV